MDVGAGVDLVGHQHPSQPPPPPPHAHTSGCEQEMVNKSGPC